MRTLAALLFAAALQAQPADDPWSRVGRLPGNAALRVHLRNREIISGRLIRWSPAELTVGSTAVPRAEIVKVSRRSRLRGAIIGFAVGFAISAPVGAYAGPYIADYGNPGAGVRLRYAAGWGVFFGGVGAGLGALAGAHTTVYRSP